MTYYLESYLNMDIKSQDVDPCLQIFMKYGYKKCIFHKEALQIRTTALKQPTTRETNGVITNNNIYY